MLALAARARGSLSATPPKSLNAGALDKKVFEDEAAFATMERSTATAAGYPAIHCLGSGLSTNDLVASTAIWANEAC